MPSLRDWGWVVVRRAGRPHTQRQDPRVQAGAVPTFRKIRERWGTLYFLASTSCIGPFVGEHTPLDDKSRLSARAVPTGLGSNLPCLPRTYVRGYHMPSLRDLVPFPSPAYPRNVRGYYMPSLRDWVPLPSPAYPGLTSGAAFMPPLRGWWHLRCFLPGFARWTAEGGCPYMSLYELRLVSGWDAGVFLEPL